MKVWKFPVEMTERFTVVMPTATVLCVQVQNGRPYIWALVDPDTNLYSERKFLIAGTGEEIDAHPDDLKYIDTWQMNGGSLVFHLFEVS